MLHELYQCGRHSRSLFMGYTKIVEKQGHLLCHLSHNANVIQKAVSFFHFQPLLEGIGSKRP